jgi:hypothetical protein
LGSFVGAGVYSVLNVLSPPPGGMAREWHEDKEASKLYGEDVGSESTGDLEISQVDADGLEADRRKMQDITD